MNRTAAQKIREASQEYGRTCPTEHGRMLVGVAKKAPVEVREIAKPLRQIDQIGEQGMLELIMALGMLLVEFGEGE